MARSGFVKSRVALRKIANSVENREKAAFVISDHLCNGNISAVGRPPRDVIDPPAGTLRDICDTEYGPDKELVEIPFEFWDNVGNGEISLTDCERGTFVSIRLESGPAIYYDVRMNERDINRVCKSLTKLTSSETENKIPKARRVSASWNEWVAAVAIVASGNKIKKEMTVSALLDLVTAQLHDWGLEERAISTVGPAARAVLDRLATSPSETLTKP